VLFEPFVVNSVFVYARLRIPHAGARCRGTTTGHECSTPTG
jgi:hypothetical protein